MTTTQHQANLRLLAARQDNAGRVARRALTIDRLAGLLIGDTTPEEAAAYWEAAAELIDRAADTAPGSLHRLADRLREIATVIEAGGL